MRGSVTSLVVVTAVVTTLTAGQTITSCTYDEASCGCRTDKGLVNLRYLRAQGIASTMSEDEGIFYWNPCRDFTKAELTAACIQEFKTGQHYDCGLHDNSASSVEDGKPLFTMESADLLRESRVTCICGTAERLDFVSEHPKLIYNLNLISIHCCIDYDAEHAKATHMSVGSILLIVFSSVVWVYFLCGYMYNRYVWEARGWHRIPHVEFWSDLPALIADGIHFSLCCGWTYSD